MTHRWPLLLLPLLLVGCVPEEDTSEGCADSGGEGLPEATIEIGHGDVDSFLPAQTDEPMELLLGTQGGWMIQPTVRVPAGTGDDDRPVLCATVFTELEGASEPLEVRLAHPCAATDDWLVCEELALFLSFDLDELEDRSAYIHFEAHTASHRVDGGIGVVLVNEE